jgi:hypothetical protein
MDWVTELILCSAIPCGGLGVRTEIFFGGDFNVSEC